LNKNILVTAINKALKSTCNYKVSAIGLNRKGDIIGTAMNKHRYCRYGGGLHAEMELVRKYGRKVKTIVICRVNNNGDILPIDPCDVCKKMLGKLGIEIVTIRKT
jgi:cytidine deaminase